MGNPKIIIDLGNNKEFGKTVLKRLKELHIDSKEKIYIFFTHYHSDHLGGFNFLHQNVKTYVYYQTESPPFHDILGERIQDQQTIKLGDYRFKIIFTPGHTKESICIYEEKNKILFSGDTIFIDGEIGWPLYSEKEIKKSIQKLLDLDVEILAPGHVHPVLNGMKHIKLASETSMQSKD